jgi:hypothetical protein
MRKSNLLAVITILVAMPLLFGLSERLDAATAGVDSANVVSNELISFMAGGTNYTQADLIQPTLTAFAGNNALNIVVPVGGSVPAPGTRSMLLTHDFNLDSGIANPAEGATAATLEFSPPLINGPGPDLVMFEVDFAPPNDFIMQIDGNTVTYLGTSYNTNLLTVDFDYFTRDAGPPADISELEFNAYTTGGSPAEDVFGIAIDLDDFGVGPLATVDTVHFGTPLNFPSFDPMLFMGINSAVGLPGDYDNSGAVGQIDLNLVLQNWGDTSPPVPAGWINEQHTGLIGQTHLNKVLQNWGKSLECGKTLP